MMIYKNDIIFNNLCYEYYQGEKSGKKFFLELREKILKELKYLSVIRMCNEQNFWKKKIRGISLSKAWNKTNNKIDNEIILNIINEMNNGFFKDEVLKNIQQEYEKNWNIEDFYYRTQGHDFSKLYTFICNGYRKSNLKYQTIEATSRCSFKLKDFQETDLYMKLIEYEHLHNIEICEK